MTASRPPSAPAKRPWYLTAALVASWIYGAQAMSDGWEELAFYRGERPDVLAVADQIASADARDAAAAAGDRWLAIKDAAKKREMPIGAASLLLGAAMVLFAARSMAGRESSRSALVQVVAVHAGLVIAAFLLTQDVTLAQSAFQMRLSEGLTRADPEAMAATREILHVIERALGPISVTMDAAVSALIVLALTRPRARAFFTTTAPGPLGEG